jgi:hypothetical protein
MNTEHVPLDPQQLARIEGVHRGFLYQHLYAAACLLTATRSGTRELVVEHDEDVQVRSDDGWDYIQVKTREADALSPSHVAGVIERFAELRAAHTAGSRHGTPRFYVVANKPPSPGLASLLEDWPEDVKYVYPGSSGTNLRNFPEPWQNLEEALVACQRLAAEVPYRKLAADTLVWKLASFVMFVSSGRGGGGSHRILQSELPDVLEQFVTQLHHLPEPPQPYRPMGSAFTPDIRGVLLLEGDPGSGKTTWAAEVIRHVPRPSIYFDVAQVPRGGLVAGLVREIVAVLNIKDDSVRSSVLAAGVSAHEALGLLNQALVSNTSRPLLVLDNAQDADAEALVRATRLASTFDWLILGHPGENIRVLGTLLGTQPVRLLGLTEDSVAAELAQRNVLFDTTAVLRVHRLAEGNPLFVRSLIRLAEADTDRDVARLLSSIQAGTHLTRTDQERLLGRIVQRLDVLSRRVMALIGLTDTPIPVGIICRAAIHVGLAERQVYAAIRELADWSVVETMPDARVRLRDAYAPLAGSESTFRPEETQHVARELASWAFERAQAGDNPIRHLMLHIRLLPAAGELARLVEIATADDEFFIEVGLMSEINRILLSVVDDSSFTEEDRFYALDSLAFWALHERQLDSASALIDRMTSVMAAAQLNERAHATHVVKQVLLAGCRKNWPEAKRAAGEILTRNDLEEVWKNIIIYNLATAAFQCGELAEAAQLAVNVTVAYFDALDLEPGDLMLASGETLLRLLGERASSVDVKRLADALDLFATVQTVRGEDPGLAWIHAHKLYMLNGAHLSAVRVGKEVVDSMLRTGDAAAARRLLETILLPAVREFGFTHEFVPLRVQHAVVLAYCGETDEARRRIRELEPYASGLSREGRTELASQAALIEKIVSGSIRLPPLKPILSEAQAIWDRKNRAVESRGPKKRPARNAPCPCGSGRKYKGCHGRSEA